MLTHLHTKMQVAMSGYDHNVYTHVEWLLTSFQPHSHVQWLIMSLSLCTDETFWRSKLDCSKWMKWVGNWPRRSSWGRNRMLKFCSLNNESFPDHFSCARLQKKSLTLLQRGEHFQWQNVCWLLSHSSGTEANTLLQSQKKITQQNHNLKRKTKIFNHKDPFC